MGLIAGPFGLRKGSPGPWNVVKLAISEIQWEIIAFYVVWELDVI